MRATEAFNSIQGWLRDGAIVIAPMFTTADGEYEDEPVWTPVADARFTRGRWIVWNAPFDPKVHSFEAHSAMRHRDGFLELRGPEVDGVPSMRILVRQATAAERARLRPWLGSEEQAGTILAIEALTAELATQPPKAPPEELPKRTFRYALRYAFADGKWSLTGIYVADEEEILFRATPDFESLEDQENSGLGGLVAEGTFTPGEIMEYLWTDGSNGVTISVARPEPVQARTLEQAAAVALNLVSKAEPLD